MKRIDLAGSWQLSQDDKPSIPGHLPGSTYLDYMAMECLIRSGG